MARRHQRPQRRERQGRRARQNGERGNDGTNGQNGENGKDGAPGQDGKSAYDLAVEAGFVGSPGQWRQSLKGRRASRAGGPPISTHTTVVCVDPNGASGKATLVIGAANCTGKTQLTVFIP